jgi:hypothetical protein
VSEPALRAPDYIKITASLISEHGWCGSNADPIGNDQPLCLNLPHLGRGRRRMPAAGSHTRAERASR